MWVRLVLLAARESIGQSPYRKVAIYPRYFCVAFSSKRLDERDLMTDTLTLQEIRDFLAGVPLFADVEESVITDVAEIAKENIFSEGEILAREGEQGDRIYVITSGIVAVSKINNDGESVDLAVRGKGDHLAEMAVLSEIPRTATLTARSEVRVLEVKKDAFKSLLGTHTRISLGIIRELIKRLDESDKRIQGQKVPIHVSDKPIIQWT